MVFKRNGEEMTACDDEWINLDFHLNDDTVKCGKKTSISGWDKDGNGNNESGFNGLPGGLRGYNGIFQWIWCSGFCGLHQRAIQTMHGAAA